MCPPEILTSTSYFENMLMQALLLHICPTLHVHEPLLHHFGCVWHRSLCTKPTRIYAVPSS